VNLRLFVAAELPDDVRAALAAWRPDDPALRAVDIAGVHVTLCFLGWVDEARVDAVGAAAMACAAPVGELAVREGLWLPPRRPRVLTIALDDPDGRLGAVQQAVVEAMVAVAGHEPEARPFLHWVSYDAYPREDIGAGFADNHAFASIIGEGCPFEAVDFDLGLFIIAPRLFYRDHHHAAPELYAPLTGPHGWRFKPGDPLVWKDADVPVWNNPWEPHATMTGDTPFLAIFCWTKDTSQPAKIIPSPDWPILENAS